MRAVSRAGRWGWVSVLALLVVGTVVVIGVRRARHPSVAAVVAAPTRSRTGTSVSSAGRERLRIAVTSLARLGSAVQDAAVAPVGTRVFVFGGLDATGASSSRISVIEGAHVRPAGTLPVAIHDAAAAGVNGHVYVLGGGQFSSFSGIASFDPHAGGCISWARFRRRFPTSRSRLSAAQPTWSGDIQVRDGRTVCSRWWEATRGRWRRSRTGCGMPRSPRRRAR